ncbi:hypothetical protein C8J57DRAFT_1704686 [Mycena rebaudengoi]|nr:hypothetical protein C8J57DRAFT_1704686 [Mycena rebaudengoi]
MDNLSSQLLSFALTTFIPNDSLRYIALASTLLSLGGYAVFANNLSSQAARCETVMQQEIEALFITVTKQGMVWLSYNAQVLLRVELIAGYAYTQAQPAQSVPRPSALASSTRSTIANSALLSSFPQPPLDELSMHSTPPLPTRASASGSFRASLASANTTNNSTTTDPGRHTEPEAVQHRVRARHGSPDGAFAGFVAAFSPVRLPVLDVHIRLPFLRIRIRDHTPRRRILLLHLGLVPRAPRLAACRRHYARTCRIGVMTTRRAPTIIRIAAHLTIPTPISTPRAWT